MANLVAHLDIERARRLLLDALEGYLVASQSYREADRLLLLISRLPYPATIKLSLYNATAPWAEALPSREFLSGAV